MNKISSMAQSLTIPTHLNLKLAALYDAPATAGPHPLVILLHGFTGWKEEEHIATLAADLAAAGVAALRFDAPGSGQSEGTWANDYRLTNHLAVVPDVLAFAKSSLPVDSARIAIWGHSMGGFVALAAAARWPQAFGGVCASQPSRGRGNFSAEQVTAWRETGWHAFSSSHFPDIKLPYAFYQDRQQYDALNLVPNLAIPSLFIAGTDDRIVPAATVKTIYDAAPEPKQYLEFDTTHFYKKDPDMRARINAATLEFFRQLLIQN